MVFQFFQNIENTESLEISKHQPYIAWFSDYLIGVSYKTILRLDKILKGIKAI